MLIPVILCGGKGTRLWPLSSTELPKPFITLPDGETLFYKALKRALALPETDKVLVVTGSSWVSFIELCLEKFPAAKERLVILEEPFSKNTAPALAAACFWAKANAPKSRLLLLTADHLIEPDAAFMADVKSALNALDQKESYWVLFGIPPKAPDTGYGYIEIEKSATNLGIVKRFVEKPSLEKAQAMLTEGNYFWNSGMLIFQLEEALAAYKTYHPEIYQPFEALPVSFFQQKRLSFTEDFYRPLPNLSSDYALLEKYPRLLMQRASFEWMDLGVWQNFAELFQPDAEGNLSLSERSYFVEAKNNFFYSSSKEKLLVGFGVEDLLVVDTPSVTLVCHRDQVKRWKDFYAKLEQAGAHVEKKL